jgi:sensor histidine kinase YesM
MSTKHRFDIIAWIGRENARRLLHVLFWGAVLLFYTLFFGYKSVDYRITFSFVIILLPVTIITMYFLNYVLIPNYLLKKRYAKFLLFFIYTLVVSLYVEMMTVMGIFILVAELNMEELHPSSTNAIMLIAAMYVVVFLGVAVKLVNHYNQNQLEIQTLKNEKTEAELKFLKAQLHPHFLFNTLNNLYALTLQKSDKASEVVLKLSDLLNYVLYECTADLVPIEKEIKQMQNYIELEKLRYGDRLATAFECAGKISENTIPPMLLMTLLENSFKHGVAKSMDKAWIKLKLQLSKDETKFDISNSMEKVKEGNAGPSGGIGLTNLKNRLELMYKGGFDLKMHRDDNSYHTSLKLKIIRTS